MLNSNWFLIFAKFNILIHSCKLKIEVICLFLKLRIAVAKRKVI